MAAHIPIRRAGNRHNLFMGGDRELVMFAGASRLRSSSAPRNGAPPCLVSCPVVRRALLFRLMAKSDPRLRDLSTCATAATSATTRRAHPIPQQHPSQGGGTNDNSDQ